MAAEEWKWYVYELIDPRTERVFYVGKGCGSRIHHHEREAKKGIVSDKTNTINEILSLGFELKKQKVAYFREEQASYDHETDVISFYGLENLTNVMPGGQTAWDRRVSERAFREEKIVPLDEWLMNNKGPKSELIFQTFAQWFRLDMHKNGKNLKILNTEDNLHLFHSTLTELIYNKMLHTLWNAVQKCDKSMEQFALRMKPYGVEIQHG